MDREFNHESRLKKYIMWDNKYNMCWLNASMALVAHNKVMKKYSGASPHSRINKIISEYDSAITILNSCEENKDEQINVARGILSNCQENILQYLQTKHVLIEDHESAFCCLYNLLVEDPVMRQTLTCHLAKECTNCGFSTEAIVKTPIITLSKIDSFDPENLTDVCICNCSKSEEKINLVYVLLPPCLIFHFENGAGNEPPPLIFNREERVYYLTGIMTLVKYEGSPVNDVIAWVRDPLFNKWLKCDNLNFVASFTFDYPDIKFQDVYMYVYESYDDLGKIIDAKLPNASEFKTEPFINLLEESDTYTNKPHSTAKTVNKESILDDVQQENLNNLPSNQDCQASTISKLENFHILEESDIENINLQTSAETVNKKSTLDDVQQENLNNLPSDQGCQAGAAGAASEAENSKSNSDKDVRILENILGGDMDLVGPCGPDCNCHTEDLEELVDAGVDFVFAYFSKLSEEYARCNNK